MEQNEPAITMPKQVYETLKSGFLEREAEWLTRQLLESPAHQRSTHPGDPFGRVFAWVWHQNPDEAMMMLGDYLAMLRDHNRWGNPSPPVRLDDVLRGLRLALPHDFDEASYDAMVAKARREVPIYYGDPNV